MNYEKLFNDDLKFENFELTSSSTPTSASTFSSTSTPILTSSSTSSSTSLYVRDYISKKYETKLNNDISKIHLNDINDLQNKIKELSNKIDFIYLHNMTCDSINYYLSNKLNEIKSSNVKSQNLINEIIKSIDKIIIKLDKEIISYGQFNRKKKQDSNFVDFEF